MTGQNTKKRRCFIAVVLPRAAINDCRDLIQSIKKQDHDNKIRWSNNDKLHLTLHFIGEINEHTIENLRQNLSKLLESERAFKAEFSGPLLFPPKRPKVVALPLKNNELLQSLHDKIGGLLHDHGIELEQRSFSPHITLGRFKKRPQLDLSNINITLPDTLTIKDIALIESELKPQGSVYTVIDQYRLTNDRNE